MREEVSVNNAIEKGKGILKFIPIMLILISFVFSVYLYKELKLGIVVSVLTVISSFFISFFYWRFAVTKWRIWAFENVRNVHELKNKAIKNRLIYEDGSWFAKMEIRNYAQVQKLNQLEKKFLVSDVYHDYFEVVKETKISFSKSRMIINAIIGTLMVGSGIFLFPEKHNYFFLIIALIGLLITIKEVKKYLNQEPQIVINSNGIKLSKKDIYNWRDIKNERIDSKANGEVVSKYLVFEFKQSIEKIQIDELNINELELEKLLQVYRLRYEKNNPSES